MDDTTTDDKLRFADMPLISKLGESQMTTAKELFETLDMYDELIEEYGKKVDSIKRALEEIQKSANLPGLRWGQLTYRATESAGRRTLSKSKLIEAGVKADVLQACYETGKSYTTRTFKRL